MGSPAHLRRTRIYVLMRDGSEFTVVSENPAHLAWDRDRARQGWPKAEDAPFVWLTYLCWYMLTKITKELPPMKLSEFENETVVVQPPDPDADDEDADVVDPTNPDREDG